MSNASAKADARPMSSQHNMIHIKTSFDQLVDDGHPGFNEMKYRLDIYRDEVEKGIQTNIPIEHENFKKNFYTALDALLIQASFIKDKKLRTEKIVKVFEWFKLKIDSFNNLKCIDTRTDKNPYENYPNMENSIKSDYYQAVNYPTIFEREHRTEDEGLMPPKDRLKEFKTKKITRDLLNRDKAEEDFKGLNNLNKFDQTKTNDKQRIMSAASSIALRTTHYTASNTGTKFFQPANLPNIETPFDPIREIKSSYSYLRPKYDYSHLILEKNCINEKNKELAEKRTQEEMKEYINQWGMQKAKFKEDVHKKHELKVLIKHYNKALKKEESQDEIVQEEKIHDNLNTNMVIQDNPLSSEEKSQLINDQAEESEKPEEITKKVETNKMRNVLNFKLPVNPDEITINIKVKEKVSEKQKELLTEVKTKHDRIPPELSYNLKSQDKVQYMRNTFNTLINVKEIDNPKDGYKYHFNPLSAFDNCNVQIMSVSPTLIQNNRPSTGFNFMLKNMEKGNDNFLAQRRTLSNFKTRDTLQLKDKLRKNNVTMALLEEAFLPPSDHVSYPKYYLPVPGHGLLSKPIEPPKKRKANPAH